MGLKRNIDLHIRLTKSEKEMLMKYGYENNLSLNQVVVNFINNLEKKEDKQNE